MSRTVALPTLLLLMASSLVTDARAGVEQAATAGATVQLAGPRAGRSGSSYFNVEGKNNGQDGRYASFGVLDFPIPASSEDATTREASLELTQSLTDFSKDGALKFFLATDTATSIAAPARAEAAREGQVAKDAPKAEAEANPAPSPLKFLMMAEGGVGDQLKGLIPAGSGQFSRSKTGDPVVFKLTLDDAAKALLSEARKAGKTVRLVVVPGDADVAATFFGAGIAKADQKPRLKLQ